MIKCFIDSQGYPRAVSDKPDFECVATYLEQDVQSSLPTINLIGDILRKIASGEMEEWSETGNAHTIMINLSGVIIENEYVDGAFSKLSIVDLSNVLETWKSIVLGSKSSNPASGPR